MSILLPKGIHSWFSDPGAVAIGTDLVLGTWAVDRPVIARYDASGKHQLVASRPKGFSTVNEQDDHDDPVLCDLASGDLLTAWSHHNGDSFCALSTDGGKSWGSVVTVNSASADAYVHLLQAGDTAATVFWFFRRFSGGANTYQHYMRRSAGATPTSFDTPVKIFELTGQRPYVHWHRTSGTRFDFFVSTGQPNEAANSLYHGYMTIAANGALEFFQSDGTSVGLEAAAPFAPSAFTQVWDGTSVDGWNWGIKTIGGNPVVVFATFTTDSVTDDTHHYYQGRWSGSAWVIDEVCEGGDTGTTPHYLYSGEVNYSGGISLDPNDINAVYVSRKYGAGDWRVEKWTHTGTFGSGTWAKATDISGATSSVNARPRAFNVGGTTHVLYWRGTYTSFTNYDTALHVYPDAAFNSAKVDTPVLDTDFTPAGSTLLLPLQDGTGTPADLTTNYTPAAVGTPTWTDTAFGYHISGFDASNYFTVNTLGSDLISGGYPFWFAVLFNNTATTASAYLLGAGRSSSNTPLFGLSLNDGSEGRCAFVLRNDANLTRSAAATGLACNDGNDHLIMGLALSATDRRLFFDGVQVAQDTNSLGTITLDRCAIGGLLRAAFSNASGANIWWVGAGSLVYPSPAELSYDLLNGRFSGMTADAGGGETVTPAGMSGIPFGNIHGSENVAGSGLHLIEVGALG